MKNRIFCYLVLVGVFRTLNSPLMAKMQIFWGNHCWKYPRVFHVLPGDGYDTYFIITNFEEKAGILACQRSVFDGDFLMPKESVFHLSVVP